MTSWYSSSLSEKREYSEAREISAVAAISAICAPSKPFSANTLEAAAIASSFRSASSRSRRAALRELPLEVSPLPL
jgi:hypothetical protein